jgi:hypothetical protein
MIREQFWRGNAQARQTVGVLPSFAPTASNARRRFILDWVLDSNGPIALRASAASTVPAHVRKSLAETSGPAISRR